MSPQQYKELFELPASRGLINDQLREAFRIRQSELLRTNHALREAFALDDPDSPERQRRQANGVKRKAETAARAGVRLSQQARIAALSRSNTARAQTRRDEYHQQARRLGYHDLEHFLRATAHLSYQACAHLMGWTPAQVYPWRQRFGIRSTAPQTRTARHDQAHHAALAGLPPGVQPADENGLLRCRICGRWRADLALHLHQTHHLTEATYRHQFQLSADTPLLRYLTQQTRIANARRHARKAAAASGRAASIAARHRWDTTARRLGYRDIVALLRAHPAAGDAAAVLGTTTSTTHKIRRRYHRDIHHGIPRTPTHQESPS